MKHWFLVPPTSYNNSIAETRLGNIDTNADLLLQASGLIIIITTVFPYLPWDLRARWSIF
jgi:hypothetical protein